MNQFQLTDLIIALFLGLVAGYFILSFFIPERLWKNLRKRSRSGQNHPPGSHPSERSGSGRGPSEGPGQEPVPPMSEREYARILGLAGQTTLYQIKLAYRQEIAKYHPDKVNHLAPEFQELARERTRLIRAAYDYFRTKYRL